MSAMTGAHLARRRSQPAAETPTEDIPTIEAGEDGWTRIEHRLERLEDATERTGAVMERAATTLDRIDARQEREWQARMAMEEQRAVREDRREAEKASMLASLWTTVKGPLTTVLLAAAAYATMRLTGAPSTPTPVQVQYVERPGDHAMLPPEEPLPPAGD